MTHDLVVELGLEVLEFGDGLLLLLDLVLELHLLVEDLLHSVILTERKAGSTLHDLVEMGDFLLQIGDDLTRVLFLLLGLLDQLPGLVHLTLQNGDGGGVLLRELDGSLHSHGVVGDGLVHVLATLEQAFLVFIGSAEGSVESLVLSLELVHRFLTDHFVEDLLEVLLELVISSGVHTHLDEVAFLHVAVSHLLVVFSI